jgi:hypothetical protein
LIAHVRAYVGKDLEDVQEFIPKYASILSILGLLYESYNYDSFKALQNKVAIICKQMYFT